MLLTILLFVSMDTIGKYLTQSYPVLQITWARFFFHALWLILFLRWRLLTVVSTQRLGLQLTRGSLMLIANAFFIGGISVMPLVTNNSILLLSPLFATALSALLLAEYVGPRRWACVVAACLGALLIIRPGSGAVQLAALLPLGSALCFALYQIITRQVSQLDLPMTSLFYTVAVGAPVSSVLMPFVWVPPDAEGWLLMTGMGLLGGIGHFTLIKAFTAAPVAVVTPFTYTNLIWATLLGYLVFSELPDRWTVIGAAIIIASGLYAFFREQQRRAT